MPKGSGVGWPIVLGKKPFAERGKREADLTRQRGQRFLSGGDRGEGGIQGKDLKSHARRRKRKKGICRGG